jgi:hypothetical protein
MHNFLTGFEKYRRDLPIYVSNPFPEDVLQEALQVIDESKNRTPDYDLVDEVGEYYLGKEHYDPKLDVGLSRVIIEFECPDRMRAIMDKYVEEIYSEKLELAHYNYIDYNPKHGNGKYPPSLPPHLDETEELVTFNYQIRANIDWELYIGDTPYQLSDGDAVIFSSVNQVHWRPKRRWVEGESVEIISFNYCLPNNWRFTKEDNPINISKYPELRHWYNLQLNNLEEFHTAWDIYGRLGRENNIPDDKHGDFA